MVSGTALGAMDGIDYISTMIDEAFNEKNEEFTPERLCNILKGLKEFVQQEAVETVVNEVMKFAGKAPQSDDMTLLAIKYNGKKCS
ncbi:MAG: SpoIIE family protein phosphatase [Candidatus Eremiobacterota bacterium]